MATAKMASRFVYVRKAIKYPFNDDEKENHNRKNNGYGRSLYAESNFICITDDMDAQRRNDRITNHFLKLGGNRKYKGIHVVISFAEDELKGTDHQKTVTASDIARGFVERAYPNTDYFFCIQNDGKSGLYHAHLYIANYDYEKGIGIGSKHGGWIYKHFINDVTRDYEKQNPEAYKFVDPKTRLRHGKSQTRLEMKAKEDGTLLFSDYVSQVAEEARQKTRSVEDYEKYLQGKGVNISKRYIKRDDKTVFRYDTIKGYTYPENMKIGKDSRIRASRLAEGQFQHEDLQRFFHEKMIKELQEPVKKVEEQEDVKETVRKTVKKTDSKKTVKKPEPEKIQDHKPVKPVEPVISKPVEPVTPVNKVTDSIEEMERQAKEKLNSFDILQDLNFTSEVKTPEKSVNKPVEKADNTKIETKTVELQAVPPVKSHTEDEDKPPETVKRVVSTTEDVKKDPDPVMPSVASTVSQSQPPTIQAIRQELKAWGLGQWIDGCNIPGCEIPEATEDQIKQVYKYGLEHKYTTDPKCGNQDLLDYAKQVKYGKQEDQEQKQKEDQFNF